MVIPDKVGMVMGAGFLVIFVLSIVFRDKNGGPPDYDHKGENYRDWGTSTTESDNTDCTSGSGSGSCGGDGGGSDGSSSD
uniref:Uncharacterized protein n=1 Tax=Geobacter metallireducens TaxID=28232 RepID=A0A831XDS3_GEOME